MRPARFCELRQFRTNWPNRQGSGIPGNSAQTGQAPAIGPFRAKPARPSPFPLRSRAITFSARRSNCRALHLFLSGAVLSPLLPEGSLLPQVPLRSRAHHFFREEVELSSPAPFPLRRRPVATFAGRLTFAASAAPEPGHHFFREEVELSSPAPFPLRRRPVATFAGRLTFAASASPEPGHHFFREEVELSSPAPFPLRRRPVATFAGRLTFAASAAPEPGHHFFREEVELSSPAPFPLRVPSLHPFPISHQPTPPVTPSSPSLPDQAAHPFSGPFQDLRSPPFHPSREHQFSLPPHPRNHALFLPGDE